MGGLAFRLCIVPLIAVIVDSAIAYRLCSNANAVSGRLRPPLAKHIDDMMFECAVYKDSLTFPSNSGVDGSKPRGLAKAGEALLSRVAAEVDEARARARLIEANIAKIRFPIVGHTTKPETKYLAKIYALLEEHNAHSGADGADKRSLVLPRDASRLFGAGQSQCVTLFPTLVGQSTAITLDEAHREFLVAELRERRVFGVFVAFVTRINEERQRPEVLPNASLCEVNVCNAQFEDLSQLDATGRIVIKAVERFRIGNVIAVTDAVVKAEVSLLRDDEGLRNPELTAENAKVIEKLFDRANRLEAEWRRLAGSPADADTIDARPKFGDKIAKLIEHVDVDRERQRVYELTGLAALEHHADLETRIWASNTTDTEQRLSVAMDVLKGTAKVLDGKIREIAEPHSGGARGAQHSAASAAGETLAHPRQITQESKTLESSE